MQTEENKEINRAAIKPILLGEPNNSLNVYFKILFYVIMVNRGNKANNNYNNVKIFLEIN